MTEKSCQKRRRAVDPDVELRQIRASIAQKDAEIRELKEKRGWFSCETVEDFMAVLRSVQETASDEKMRGNFQTFQNSQNPQGPPLDAPPKPDQALNGGSSERLNVQKKRELEIGLLWTSCKSLVEAIKRHRYSKPFLEPVDPVKYNVPDYYDIIKKPMDLGTISKKLGMHPGRRRVKQREYKSVLEFRDDMELVWANCRTYNRKGDDVREMGDALFQEWSRRWKDAKIEARLEKIEREWPAVDDARDNLHDNFRENASIRSTVKDNGRVPPPSDITPPPSKRTKLQTQSTAYPKPQKGRAKVIKKSVKQGVPMSASRPTPPNSAVRKLGIHTPVNASQQRVGKIDAGSGPGSGSGSGSSTVSIALIVKAARELSEECGKFASLEDVPEQSQAFVLRRRLSSQLEKLPPNSVVLKQVLAIMEKDPVFAKGAEVDIDSLALSTVKKLHQFLEKKEAGGKLDPGPSTSHMGGAGDPERGHASEAVQNSVQHAVQQKSAAQSKAVQPPAVQQTSMQQESQRGAPLGLVAKAGQALKARQKAGSSQGAGSGRLMNAIHSMPSRPGQQNRASSASRLPGTLQRQIAAGDSGKAKGPGKRSASQLGGASDSARVKQVKRDANLMNNRKSGFPVPPPRTTANQEEGPKDSSLDETELDKRRQAARIVSESRERERREFLEKEKKRVAEKREEMQRKAEEMQRKAEEKANFLAAIAGVEKKIDLYTHETAHQNFLDCGVTETLTTTDFGLHPLMDGCLEWEDSEPDEEIKEKPVPKIELAKELGEREVGKKEGDGKKSVTPEEKSVREEVENGEVEDGEDDEKEEGEL